jgi:hypothetical protein
VWSVNGVLSISSSPPSLGLAIVSVWPRLQSSQERPPWLRVDFDHWEELSDGEEGAEGGGEDDGDATTGHKKPLPRERLEEIKKKQAQMMSEMEKVKKEATQLWKSWSHLSITLYTCSRNTTYICSNTFFLPTVQRQSTKNRQFSSIR